MSSEDVAALLRPALDGCPGALSQLVVALTPVVQARIAGTLTCRSRWSGGRGGREEVEDLSQEVFVTLLAREARVLRSWQPERGLSLASFVGLVAARQALSFLRDGRCNPLREATPLPDDEGEAGASEGGPEELTASRERLSLLLDRLREELSPRGWRLFELLFVHELTLQEVRAATGLSDAAVYAWRSRLRRLARRLVGETPRDAIPREHAAKLAAQERR